MKVDDESLDLAIMLIKGNPLLTLIQIRADIPAIFPGKADFSTSTLQRSLEGELLTVKMARDIPGERNSVRVKDARAEYAAWMINTGITRHRVYVDECIKLPIFSSQ